MLSLRATYGHNIGTISLDGVKFDGEIFKKKCYLVGQFDKNWPHLTVYETCTYAERLFGVTQKNSSNELVSNVVSNLIDEVGLTSVSHTRNSKLSGGQQRRLSLAIAMTKNPELLFLDEVTSGLDSASANSVCQALRRLVDKNNMLIICTIHQPSTKIFLEYFDKVILLSKGKVAYFGGTKEAHDYFSDIGYPVPAMTNPSEHFLELLNPDFEDNSTVDQIIGSWNGMTYETGFTNVDKQVKQHSKEQLSPLSDLKLWKLTRFEEVQILLKRHFKMTYRDVSIYQKI